jgi:hypothetical protein
LGGDPTTRRRERETTVTQRPDDGHDITADEQDLLTIGEAAARIRDELAAVVARIQALEAREREAPGDSDELAAARRRRALLEEAAARFARR